VSHAPHIARPGCSRSLHLPFTGLFHGSIQLTSHSQHPPPKTFSLLQDKLLPIIDTLSSQSGNGLKHKTPLLLRFVFGRETGSIPRHSENAQLSQGRNHVLRPNADPLVEILPSTFRRHQEKRVRTCFARIPAVSIPPINPFLADKSPYLFHQCQQTPKNTRFLSSPPTTPTHTPRCYRSRHQLALHLPASDAKHASRSDMT